MWTTFSDNEDKRLVMLALEFEILGSRIVWNNISRKMSGRRAPKQLEMRLRALIRTSRKQLARFPPCFLSTHRMQPEFAYSFQRKQNARSVASLAMSPRLMYGNRLESQRGMLGSYYLQRYQELFALLGV
ncbi:hypothetical protein GN244_ATG11490 [Phytophthora infestans]|uniref:Myb-like domain-containing protein n=1 Tax=Phytophthora infestans TaxID=4787 RepID=A0A833WT93_PHYIN|nr:hypothetical protein GN244_ATG11490 [Phytophthora infestans]KAF4146147.1 hypothetical protein GN958_ATG04622 [Phytophthora infestans]